MRARIEDKSVTSGSITIVQRVGVERKFVTLDTGERGYHLVPADPLEYALPGGGAIKAASKSEEMAVVAKAIDVAKALSKDTPCISRDATGRPWTKADRNHTAVCLAKINEMHLHRRLPDLSILTQEAAMAIELIYKRMYSHG